jgi:sugar phosphate isomerase/epimerase
MSETKKRRVGVSMEIDWLPDHLDWLLNGSHDLEIKDPLIPGLLDEDWHARIVQARRLLDGHTGQIGIHGPFHDLTLTPRDPRVRALVIERFKQGLAFAAEIQASYMVIHTPFVFFGNPWVCHTGQMLTDEIALAQEVLKPILPLVEEINCVLVIENNVNETSPIPLMRLVESFASPYVKQSFDTGHAYIAHRYGGGPTPHEWVRQSASNLAHLHLQDTDGESDYHWAPGDGAINWQALFSALDAVPQPLNLIIEVARERIARSITWLASQGYGD